MRRVPSNERGIALIITLLVVALLTITVVEFFYSVEVDSHMARSALNGLQASLLARSGIALGEAYLLKDQDPTVDAFTEEWCPQVAREGRSCRLDETNSQMVVPEGMRLRVEIFDEGAKININFTRPTTQQQWRASKVANHDPTQQPLPFESWRNALGMVLESRGVNPDVADALEAYWDAKFEAIYGPAQTGTAIPGQTPSPAVSATAQAAPLSLIVFTAIDDLAGISPSFKPSDIRRVRPVINALANALPRVNVNTASREVLTAITGDAGAVDNIIAQRQSAPLKQSDIQLTASGGQPNPQYKNARAMLGATSQFYLIRASAIVNVSPLTGRGGISRSAEMVVVRLQRPPVQQGAANATSPWTLQRLSWQKEGGAALFRPEAEAGTEDVPDPTL